MALSIERYFIKRRSIDLENEAESHKKGKCKSRKKRKDEEKISKKMKRQVSVEEIPISSKTDNQLWVCKYRPNCLTEMIGSHDLFQQVKQFILDRKDEEDNEALLLIGPPGVGKTCLVYAIAQEMQYKIFEVNCGLAKKIVYTTEKLCETVQTHQVCRNETPKITSFWTSSPSSSELNDFDDQLPELSLSSNCILLFDDIDFMVGNEVNGFWRALNNLVQDTKKPIILTASRYSEYLEHFISSLKTHQIEPPSHHEIAQHLAKIISNEQPGKSLTNVSRISSFNGDVRRTINECQYNCDNFEWIDNQKVNISHECDQNFLYYNSVCLSDMISSQTGIMSPNESRSCFLKGHDIPYQEKGNGRQIAIDFIETINGLTSRLFGVDDSAHTMESEKEQDKRKKFNDKISESFKKYNRIMSNVAIATEYFPYLSLITTHQSLRRYRTRGSKKIKIPLGPNDPFLSQLSELN